MTGQVSSSHEVRVREVGDTSAAFCRCGWQGWAPSYRTAVDKREAHKRQFTDTDGLHLNSSLDMP